MDVKIIEKNKKEVFNNFLPKINTEQIQELINSKLSIDLNELNIDDFINKNNIKSELSSYDIAENLFYLRNNELENYLSERITREKINEVRELTPQEKIDIKINDFVSHRGKQRQFVKGKVVKIKENTFVLKNNKNETFEVPKNFTVKMFPGQKFDAREVDYNLIDLKIVKKMNNTIDLNNVFKSFNLNSSVLTFSDLKKSDRIKLLKGEETDVIAFNIKVKMGDKFVNKVDKIRLKAFRYKGQINLQKIKGFTNNIYGKEIKAKDLEKLKAGETVIYKNLTTRDKKEFSVAAFWDNGLEQVRVKKLNENPLTKLTVLGNYPLNEKQIEALNTKGEITVNKTLKNGENHNYKITYNKALDTHKVEKLKKENTKEKNSKDIKKGIPKTKKRGNKIS